MMESPAVYPGFPDSPMEQDEAAYPCKGCGEILEEGKAFELAGNRWHIDCFRCNTCGTLLDSDANLLLLGDGSLICNNCTYSCSACGNKIEDLAILTGDQAFCATCFKCRNCKKKIENLKYARTSQGIFCMECHESLMQRRRKKATKGNGSRHKQYQQQQQLLSQSNSGTMLLDKSLPSLPPNAVPQAFSPDTESPLDSYSDTPTELPRTLQKKPSSSRSSSYSEIPTEPSRPMQKRPSNQRSESSRSGRREMSPAARVDDRKGKSSTHRLGFNELKGVENLILPSTTYNRTSMVSQRSDDSTNGENFFIPMALDPNPAPGPSPLSMKANYEPHSEPVKSIANDTNGNSKDYFTTKKPTVRKVSQEQGGAYCSPPLESPRESRQSSGPSSPHIAYQEIGRDITHESPDYVRKRRDNSISGAISYGRNNDTSAESSVRTNGESRNGKFMLGEVPKNKKSGHSPKNSKSEKSPPVDTSLAASKSRSAPSSANVHIKDQQVVSPPTESPASVKNDQDFDGSSQTTQDSRSHENGSIDSSTSHSSPVSNQQPILPRRGDSLLKSGGTKHGVPVGRKEDTATNKISTRIMSDEDLQDKPSSAPATSTSEHPSTSILSSSTRSTPRPIDSPSSLGHHEILYPPPRARDRPKQPKQPSVSDEKAFSTPRAPPQAPINYQKTRNDSVSTIKSELSRSEDAPASPKLPRHLEDQPLDDDVVRLLGNETHQEHSSFLRRVSNSVRHNRSYSDRGTRLSKENKWPKSPLIGNTFPPDATSSTSSSPDTRDEVSWLKSELHLEQEKNAETERKLQELEAAVEAKKNIQDMNTELRRKRTTMVELDVQKEIVVRELEILTEHIANTKKSSDPLDFGGMSNTVVRQFGESLQALKDSYVPDIEDLAQQKLELKEDVAQLTQDKEKSFTEFEQLSSKNAQLAEMNNQLVHQIQELIKANAGPSLDIVRPPLNGLGIYTPSSKDRSTASVDGQQRGPSLAESNFTGSTMTEPDAENATYLNAPQVVNIKRIQPKKFNWKKGQNVAKGVTKGLKGAFTSNDTKTAREGQYTEGVPYGSIPPNQDYSLGSVPKSQIHDPSRQGFGFFGTQRKPVPQQQWKNQPTNGTTHTNSDGFPPLFGSELEHRAEYERSGIPGIVQRCIEEVETRGMDVEGIYRKSGGNSQILQIREGFERSNDYDISDPDLDINAVTSTLKQYFRKLPTPLITFPVYDLLLNSVSFPQDSYSSHPPNVNQNPPPQRPPAETIGLMRSAILELPPRHRDTLEFLVFHLARVVEREKDNLMTSLNVAVVFAPTVMRPESLKREMQESQEKNRAVQFLIENCQAVFQGQSESGARE